MQIKLEKTFDIDSSEDAAWEVLKDINEVAHCMPGASITQEVDDTHYEGQVKTRIGPASMTFNGNIEVLEVDQGKHEMHLLGKGQDSKGSSTAEMDLTATVVRKDDTHSELHGIATVTVNGKAANLGGRMMNQVADQILNQFGKNFVTNVHEHEHEHELPAANDEVPVANKQVAEPVHSEPTELNGLAFAWQVFVSYIKSFFVKDPASSK